MAWSPWAASQVAPGGRKLSEHAPLLISSSVLRPLCSHFILENYIYPWEAQTQRGWLGTSWER